MIDAYPDRCHLPVSRTLASVADGSCIKENPCSEIWSRSAPDDFQVGSGSSDPGESAPNVMLSLKGPGLRQSSEYITM